MEDFERSPFVLPPRQERSRVALARIVEAAAKLMARKGSDNFSMAEVAEAAEIPLGSIYRRFKGKDSIVQAILLDIFTRCEDIIRNRMQERSFTSASEVVAELAAGFAEMSEQNAELFRVFVRHPVTSDELLDVVMKGRRRLVSYYREAISVHLQSVPEQRRDIVDRKSTACRAKCCDGGSADQRRSWPLPAAPFTAAARRRRGRRRPS
jgi:AcrR family transcriptional regulator